MEAAKTLMWTTPSDSQAVIWERANCGLITTALLSLLRPTSIVKLQATTPTTTPASRLVEAPFSRRFGRGVDVQAALARESAEAESFGIIASCSCDGQQGLLVGVESDLWKVGSYSHPCTCSMIDGERGP